MNINPLLKKQFILESYDYNSNLKNPYFIYYENPTDYWYKNNYWNFSLTQPKNYHSVSFEQFSFITNKEINNEISNKNSRKIIITNNDFLLDYFKFFFEKHKDKQLDLLKFFNTLLNNHSVNIFKFLSQFDKKTIEPLLIESNQWIDYSKIKLDDLDTLMINFNEGFRVSIFKKLIESNLKFINKNPLISKNLETFLNNNYPNSLDIIACNINSIKKRNDIINFLDYDKVFSKNKKFCITDNIDIDKLQKIFQISGWENYKYVSLIKEYHNYLKNKLQFEITCFFSLNNKSAEFFIKLESANFSLENYKKDIFTLLNFFKNESEQIISQTNLNTIFLNQKLSENLAINHSKNKTKQNKI